MAVEDTAGIKRANKARIRKLLVSGQGCTKQQIARLTGLSVASCNTYLNEMEAAGEVLGEKRRLHDVGRSAAVYRLNEEFESILCVALALLGGRRVVRTEVLSPTGALRHREERVPPRLDAAAVEKEIGAALARFPNTGRIVVGTPSVAENGVVRHSDLPELEGAPLRAMLEERFRLPVFLANDMHYKAYGYYRQAGAAGEIVTLMNYPAGVLPGTATVYRGTVLTGRNLFAGMVGFLDYGMTHAQQIERLRRPTARPLVEQVAVALISILNPHRLLFTGDLLEESDLEPIRAACLRCIPKEYMPDFVFLPDTEMYYRMGMYWTAVDRKEPTE